MNAQSFARWRAQHIVNEVLLHEGILDERGWVAAVSATARETAKLDPPTWRAVFDAMEVVYADPTCECECECVVASSDIGGGVRYWCAVCLAEAIEEGPDFEFTKLGEWCEACDSPISECECFGAKEDA